MEQLRFHFKTRTTSGGTGDNDVNITFTKNESKGELISFTFRNKTHKKIAPATGAIGWAIMGPKLYFVEAPEEQGYKLSRIRDGENRYVQIAGKKNRELIEWAKRRAGAYSLLRDEERGLWYIDTDVLVVLTKAGKEIME